MLSDYEKKAAFGFIWETPDPLYFLKSKDVEDAVFSFRNSVPGFVSRTLNTLENIGVTVEEAKIVVEYGKGTDSLTTFQIRTVENFGKACAYMFDGVRKGQWTADKDELCNIHALLSRDEVRNPGTFRKTGVMLEGCVYVPPPHNSLDTVFKTGITALNEIKSVPERAMVLFLFLARSQFFENCNKRTAALAMSGLLMNNSWHAPNINEAPGKFLSTMADFYEKADATDAMDLFNNMAKMQFRDIKDSMREPEGPEL